MTKFPFKETSAEFTKYLRCGTRLTPKQAELVTLNNMTLPNQLLAIGKTLAGLEHLPPVLENHRETIHHRKADIAGKIANVARGPEAGFAANPMVTVISAGGNAVHAEGPTPEQPGPMFAAICERPIRC